MNPCRDFFNQHLRNTKKVDALIQEPDRLAWEALSASEHSPGPVENDEILCRQMLQPIHIQDDGDISPMAFLDVMDKGLSTDRLKFRDAAESIREGAARAAQHNIDFPEKPRRTFIALAKFDVGYLRNITAMNSKERALAVYDTAEPLNAAHADVCIVVAKTNENRRSIRAKLYDAAKNAGLIN